MWRITLCLFTHWLFFGSFFFSIFLWTCFLSEGLFFIYFMYILYVLAMDFVISLCPKLVLFCFSLGRTYLYSSELELIYLIYCFIVFHYFLTSTISVEKLHLRIIVFLSPEGNVSFLWLILHFSLCTCQQFDYNV